MTLQELQKVVIALEAGDWRTGITRLFDGRGLGDGPVVHDLVVCLRFVALSMRVQCARSDASKADRHLASAQAALDRPGRFRLPVADPERRLPELRRRTKGLVARERADLDALRLVFVDARKGGGEIVRAHVEYLTWAEFDPWTVEARSDDQVLLDLTDEEYKHFRPADEIGICRRATNLRRFADLRGGTVNEKAWGRLGYYPGVHAAALRVLAAEKKTRGRPDLPVRLGRLRAWQEANIWLRDIRG